MMSINNKFQYTSLRRETKANGFRLYITPSGKVPSVTTVLDKTQDKTFLIRWRKRIGDEQANQITKNSAKIGTLMHSHLENYIDGTERPKPDTKPRKLASDMADEIINRALIKVNEVWGKEVVLWYPELYAGTTDLVGLHEGSEAIIDFKNSRKKKKKQWVDGYLCQGVAYAIAHNELFNTNINKVVILISTWELEFQEFIIEGNDFSRFTDKWLCKLDEYYS